MSKRDTDAQEQDFHRRITEEIEKGRFIAGQRLREAAPSLSDPVIANILARFAAEWICDAIEKCAERGWNAYAMERLMGILHPDSPHDGLPIFTTRTEQKPSVQPAGPFMPPPHGNLGKTPAETQALAEARYKALALAAPVAPDPHGVPF